MKKATDDQVVSSYKRHKSIYSVASELGMRPQRVHERLVRLGVPRNNPKMTDRELQRIREVYESGIVRGDGKLDLLVKELGRTKQLICRMAGRMGLTTMKRKVAQQMCTEMSERSKRRIKENGHPRGFKGRKHTAETKAVIAEKSSEFWNNIDPELMSDISLKAMKTKLKKYGCTHAPRQKVSWRQGWREVGGIRFYARSAWEANYARYLEFLKQQDEIALWEHEPKTFWFEQIKRGTRSYLPDFRVTNNDDSQYYVEVKGWMDDRSKTKLKRMSKYYPDVKLEVVNSKSYKALSKTGKLLIPGWE